MKIELLLVQLEAIAGDIEKNILKVRNLLESSGYVSADIIVLPELWTCGWDCVNFDKYAQDMNTSRTLEFLKEIAIKYNSNVIGGSSVLHKKGEKNRNTSIILDRKGNFIDSYDKFHLFSHRGQSEGSFLQAGDGCVVVNTDVAKVGVSICYDIRFPEMFRLYMMNGADIIVNMAAWPKVVWNEYEVLAKARAIENQIYFVSSCLTGKINEDFEFSGNSSVIDYRGNIIKTVAMEEKAFKVIIDLDEMHQFREQIPMLSDIKSNYQILEKK